MMKIAENYNDFIEKSSEAERKVLNMPLGQSLTKKLLEEKLKQNLSLTPEEWTRTKSEFMTFLFVEFLKRTPEAMSEISSHVWEELRKN